jgi:signal transduction histidine kinase
MMGGGYSLLAMSGQSGTMLVQRRHAAWLAAAGLALGVFGAAVAAFVTPSWGVIAGSPGGTVVYVLPGGPTWRDSIRVGQTVVVLHPGDRPEEWVLETSDGSVRFRSTGASTIDEVRSSLPAAIVACALGVLGVLMVRTRPAWAAAIAVAALSLATLPFLLTGDPIQWTAAALLVSGAVALWLAEPGKWRPARIVVASVVVVAAVAWAVIRFSDPGLYEPAETARTATLITGATLGWLATIDIRRSLGQVRRAGFPSHLDLLALGLIAAAAVASRAALQADWWVTAAIGMVGALLYSRWRRGLAAAADRVLLAETRERAAVEAIEAERARMARDLHDVPLQQLSGVIKGLELIPGASDEATALRDVAQHLREVAIELHPPQLQDLGLGAALAHLVAQADAKGGIPVELDLDDRLGTLARERLPPETELAIYRIAQEAIENAQRHGGGSLIEVTASIRAGHARVEVRDDGSGIDQADVEAAQAAGHFGIASMEQRAAIIGARLRVDTGPSGTRVTAEWDAP